MKRYVVVFLLPIIFLLGCNKEISQTSPCFYYPTAKVQYHKNDNVILPYPISDDYAELEIYELLQHYLNGPDTGHYINPFPDNTKLIALSIADTNGIITLSSEFGQLEHFDRILAATALLQTLNSISGAETVTIITDGVAETFILSLSDIVTSFDSQITEADNIYEQVPEKEPI